MNVYVHKRAADVLRVIKTIRTRCMSVSSFRGCVSNISAYFEACDVVCEKTLARVASEVCFGVRHRGRGWATFDMLGY